MGDEFTVFLTSLCDMNFLYAVIRGLPVQLRRFLADDHLFGTSGIGEILRIRHDLFCYVLLMFRENRRRCFKMGIIMLFGTRYAKINSSVFLVSTSYHDV